MVSRVAASVAKCIRDEVVTVANGDRVCFVALHALLVSTCELFTEATVVQATADLVRDSFSSSASSRRFACPYPKCVGGILKPLLAYMLRLFFLSGWYHNDPLSI